MVTARLSAALRCARVVPLAALATVGAAVVSTAVAVPAVGTPAKASSSHSTPRPRSESETDMGNALLSMLNRERKANHLPALRMNSHLQSSARRHDMAMARANTMSHQLPGEPQLGDRVTQAGYRWSWAGENIGWNSDTSQRGVLQLEQMMYDEKPPNDGHRKNILSTHFQDIGVDVYLDNAHQRVWLTTDFGRH